MPIQSLPTHYASVKTIEIDLCNVRITHAGYNEYLVRDRYNQLHKIDVEAKKSIEDAIRNGASNHIIRVAIFLPPIATVFSDSSKEKYIKKIKNKKLLLL